MTWRFARSIQGWGRLMAVSGLLFGAPALATAQTGTVTGALTRAGTNAPVTSGTVRFCPAVTGNCTQVAVNAAGTYTTTLPVGSYVAYTGSTGLVNEIADDVACPVACDDFSARRLGAPFVVANGGKVVRNFALALTGSIRGRVVDSTTGAPIVNLTVRVVTMFGTSTSSSSDDTDATGTFVVPSLGAGTYFAYTQGAALLAHAEEIFGDLPCVAGCLLGTVVGSGQPITIAAGATTAGVDFALDPDATISGVVSHPSVIGGAQSILVEARTRVGGQLMHAGYATVGPAGAYTLTGLHAGSYFVSVSSTEFVDEVYRDRPCEAQCRDDEISAGQAITVPKGGAASNIDIALEAGGSLAGTIREAGTGTPLPAGISVYRRVGLDANQAGQAQADASGAFVVRGLAPGPYIVVAGRAGYTLEIFGGKHWAPTNTDLFLDVTPVAVAQGLTTAGVDITLDRKPTISGRVGRAPSNAAVSGVLVRAFRQGFAATADAVRTDDAGNYTLQSLAPGTYVVATDAADLANEVYNDVACPNASCTALFALANGVGVPAPSGAATTGIDFTLAAATGPPGPPADLEAVNVPGGVRFTWSVPARGAPATSYLFDAGLTPGTRFVTLPVGSTSLTVPGVPPGTFFIRVRGVNAAGAGAPSPELALLVGGGGVVAPSPPTELTPAILGARLSLTWRAPSQGPTPSGYLLEVGSAVGLADIAVVPVATTSFRFDGVPPGYYFVRVRSVVGGMAGRPSGDVVMVAGNVPAPPSEPRAFFSSVAGNVVTLRWFQPAFGPVASYVLEAGTAPGLANITVFNTGNAATSLVVPGVPPGTYHLRLRALNAQGSSPPSTEHVLVVP